RAQPVAVGIEHQLEQVVYPVWQCRMETVEHPLALSAVGQQPTVTQLRQVAGYLRLTFIQRADQFAHAQLLLTGDQQRDARTGFVGQALAYQWRGEVVGHRHSPSSSWAEHMLNRIFGKATVCSLIWISSVSVYRLKTMNICIFVCYRSPILKALVLPARDSPQSRSRTCPPVRRMSM